MAAGTDHASIATEVKVIQSLKEQGINKADLTREEFLDKCWEWRKEYGGHAVPMRPVRVGSTQSNMSMPTPTPRTSVVGLPTPMR